MPNAFAHKIYGFSISLNFKYGCYGGHLVFKLCVIVALFEVVLQQFLCHMKGLYQVHKICAIWFVWITNMASKLPYWIFQKVRVCFHWLNLPNRENIYQFCILRLMPNAFAPKRYGFSISLKLVSQGLWFIKCCGFPYLWHRQIEQTDRKTATDKKKW